MGPQAGLPASMEQHVSCFKSNSSAIGRENCSQCRWRKVRCDRRRGPRGGCGSCERLGLGCSFSQSPRALGLEQDFVKPGRLRGPRACAACREKKVRCSATIPQCANCKRRGLDCTYPTPKRSLQSGTWQDAGLEEDQEPPGNVRCTDGEDNGQPSASLPTETPPCPGEGTASSPSPAVTDSMLALVDAFFETLYPLPSYAFLHPETTKRRCRNGQMHRALASAICAVTSHHLDHAHSNDQDRWIQAAEQSIWMHLECPTIPRLQTLLLVIYHRIEAGRFQRAFMLTATAARFASAMRLNHERPVLDPIAREVRRRIVWSLKIVERYFCVGLPEFELCPIEGIYLDFPSSEDDFGAEQPGEHGAYSLHVRLEVVRRDIMKLTRGMTHLDEPIPSLMELVRQHATTLEEIASSMPSGDEVVVPDLLGSSWLTRRLPMYISYHQAHCDLYRILLPGYPEAAPSAVLATFPSHHLANAERQCLYHASAVIRILTGLNHDSPSRRLLEFDTAICAYHAARLMLFISRFGREREGRPSPEFAASRADLCLAALRRFFPSSVLAAPIIEELQYSIGVFRQQHQREGFAASELSRGRDREEQRAEERTCSGRRNSSPDQKLAVHSLLRQAEFEDEDEEKAVPADLASAEELSQSLQSARGDKVVPEPGPGSLRRTAEVNTAAIELGIGSMAPNMGVGGWGMGPFGIGQGLEGTRTVDVEQPLFAWGGPQDWNWLFDPEQPC